MKSNRVYFFGVILVLVLILVYTFLDTGVNDTYERGITQYRLEKDRNFKSLKDSPIKDKEHFKQLNYFAPDQSFRLTANLELIQDTTRLKVRMTDGKEESFIRFAYAAFSFGGKSHRLLLLKSAGDEEDELFLPFTDQTNGFDTYGGGRYLYPEWELGNQQIVLDFNKAFNPYCAYNDDYSCPVPPKENHLEIAVKAGEKNFEK